MQINDQDITVNSGFIPSANVLTAANKARGMLRFMKKFIFMLDEGGLRIYI